MSAGSDAWEVIQQEFSSFGDVESLTRVVVRLIFAAVLGGILGYEREGHGAAAGFRTHMLVSVGCALFVVTSLEAGMATADLSRVIQGLATGIGFIGAGAIIRPQSEAVVKGLTTAANVWVTAAIGTAAGLGQEGPAVVGTALALIILALLRKVER